MAATTIAAAAQQRGIKYGAGFQRTHYQSDAQYAQALKDHCSIYSTNVELRMNVIQPTQGVFDYSAGDAFAAQALADGKDLRGHPIMWGFTTPAWVNGVITSGNWRSLIDDHLAHVMGRWKLTTCDLFNEVIEPSDGIQGGYRNTIWYQNAGADYIGYAFKRARAYDPSVGLYLSEYDLEEDSGTINDDRRTATLNLLRKLLNEGAPITGLSLQCHLKTYRPFTASKFAAFLAAVHALGLQTIVTEFDVRTQSIPAGSTQDSLVAARAREVMDVYLANNPGPEFLTWGLSDKYSWLNDAFPAEDNNPLPLDDNMAPKPMHTSMLAAFQTTANTIATTGGQAMVNMRTRKAGRR